jgi:hypothetical protein
MRLSLLATVIFAAVGCGGVHVDDTMNQQNPELNGYPAGPFGYTIGSVIADLKFIGKADPLGIAGTSTYDTLQIKPMSLNDYHQDASVKLLIMSGVAGWCGPCNDEQTKVPAAQATYEPQGVRFLEAMIEGYKLGTASTEHDLDRWQSNHDLHVGLALDPNDYVHQYADIAAFPLNMAIRTSDMQIVDMQVGEVDVNVFVQRNLNK